ncbi:MAG TPA: hypothetical protein VMV44_05590 [Rectinemataceae bacterium]|nr:hypothetical protein [Rectinemataceae bacterium]
MGSGKRRRPEALVLLVLAAALLSACGTAGGDSFQANLARLDAALSARDFRVAAGTFDGLYREARDSGNWLSLAKRSLAAEGIGDKARATKTAEASLRAFAQNPNVASVAAWLYIRDGRADRALALFPLPLDPGKYLDLWAEARLRLLISRPVADQESCRLLADATGDPSWYLEAALLAMRKGDSFSAQAWLRKGMAGGLHPPASLLWDAGLNRELADSVGPDSPPGDLVLAAGASWLVGDREKALALWQRAKSGGNDSWKVDAATASLLPSGDGALAAARALAARYKSEPEALRYAAAILLREGRPDEALALVPGLEKGSQFLPEALGIELGSAKEGEGRFIARAIRLAEEHRGMAEAREFALRVLLAHGRWDEYLVVYDGASEAERSDPRWWFWETAADLVRGDFSAASQVAEALGASPAGAGGPEGAFAQGLVDSLRGREGEAEERFKAALDLSSEPSQRAAALKEIGRLEESAGRHERAMAAWSAAVAADPDDAEARILATGGNK